MNTVEERLREALSSRAEAFTPDPAAITLVRRRVGRGRRRLAIGVIIPVAVAVGAAVPAANLLRDHGRSEAGRGGALASPGDTSHRLDSLVKRFPPKDGMSPFQPARNGYGASMRVWAPRPGSPDSTTDVEPVVCMWSPSTELTIAGCLGLDGKPLTGHAMPRQHISGRTGEMWLGFADDRVASVAVQLTRGGEIPGSLMAVKGAPYRLWQAGTPGRDTIRSFVFRDGSGAVLKRVPARPCSDQRPPASGQVRLAGAGHDRLTATWTGGCLVFWTGGRSVGDLHSDGRLTMTSEQDGASWWWGWSRWWYGVTGVTTKRVELTLPDGRRISGQVVQPGWRGQRVALFAGELPQGVSGHNIHRATVTGYDAAGKVLWRRAMP